MSFEFILRGGGFLNILRYLTCVSVVENMSHPSLKKNIYEYIIQIPDQFFLSNIILNFCFSVLFL